MSGHGSSLNERISHRPSIWQMCLVRAEHGVSRASVSKVWLNKLKLLPPDWWISFRMKCCQCVCHPSAVQLSNVLQWSGLNGWDLHAASDNSISKCRVKIFGWKQLPRCRRQIWMMMVLTFSHLEEVLSWFLLLWKNCWIPLCPAE